MFVIIFLLSGCIDIADREVRYRSTPISLEFSISYGYYINSSGEGRLVIDCLIFLPKPLNGSVLNLSIIGNYSHEEDVIGDNQAVRWNFSEEGGKRIKIGVSARVRTSSFATDLIAEGYVDVSEIDEDLKRRFCGKQRIDDLVVIHPDDPMIRDVVGSVGASNNSFEIAKRLFRWLKRNTKYSHHDGGKFPQTDLQTLNLGMGDCDDLSILYISLCRSAGIPARLVKGYLIREMDGGYRAIPHAWAEVYVGSWLPVECAGTSEDIDVEVHQDFGIETANHLRVYVDDGTDENLSLSSRGVMVRYEKGLEIEVEPFVEVKDVEILEVGSLVVRKNGERLYI